MKYLLLATLLLTTVLPAWSELSRLTDNDLNKIRLIVKDEVDKAIKDSEIRMKRYIDVKFDSIDKRITYTRNLSYALIGLISVVIGIPLWRNRKDDSDLKKQVETLTQEIETLKKQIQAP